MLFHVIIHGMAWNPIRQSAGLLTLYTHQLQGFHDRLQRLISTAQKNHLNLRFKNGLQYLDDNFHPSIPPSVMDSVLNLPVSYLEKIEYRS